MATNPWWAPWTLNRIIEPLMRSLRIQTPSLAGMKAGDRALDICCGTGALVLHLAKMNLVSCGIDMDPRVIQVAEKKRVKLGLEAASFQVANALNVPFEDDFFDYVRISEQIDRRHGGKWPLCRRNVATVSEQIGQGGEGSRIRGSLPEG